MNSDQKKFTNPLLTASVTGGTYEDFTQNVFLMPAAEIPSPPAPVLETTPQIENNTSDLHYTNQPGNYSQTNQQIQFDSFVLQSESNLVEEELKAPKEPELPQPSLQSVFSSVSSYILGSKSVEPERTTTYIPSVVDNLINTPSDANTIPPVTFYSPQEVNLNLPPPPEANSSKGPVNTYRRGGLKRPTYAPIPGFSGNNQLPNPSLPLNLPPQPPKPISPIAGVTPKSTPPQPFINTSHYFQPELSGYATPAQSNVIDPIPIESPTLIQPEQFINQVIERPKTAESPFLKPVSSSEINQPFLPNVDATTVQALIPTIDTSTYPSSSACFANPPHYNPIMSSFSSNETQNTNIPFSAKNDDDKNVLNNTERVYMYRPIYHHWFFKTETESKVTWTPFSMSDSLNLEEAYLSTDLSPEKIIATDGGRYDVNILRRERTSVYWKSEPNEVRRCSWFHKGNSDGRYVPYEENIAAKLEEEYKIAHESNSWNRKVELSNGESVIFHGPDVLVLFPPANSPDAWGNTPNQPRPRVVKRGMDEFHIEEGEPMEVDHLLFLVHGIGSVCDLKFRSVEEVVDEFRSISLQLVQSHYRSSCERGVVNRVEVLPISWHEKLHSDDTGVDKKLKQITLESIPKLREFSNDTILDVLFYTSPVYCQTIISTVGNELNRIFELFKQRNPTFNGEVSLGGHSLGSLILFDILCHQHPETESSENSNEAKDEGDEDVISPLKPHPKERRMSRRISYMMGTIGTGQPQLNYPHLQFNPKHFFALGSPIGMFVTVRGLDTLGDQFALPTCPNFFNIFHPYDPVAYRIEPLINSDLTALKPVLIPHHKGRKRMHLELKETMARVGADLKQKLLDSMKNTWNSFYQFTLFKSQTSPPNLEEEVDKVLEEQLTREQNESEVSEDVAVEAEQTDLSLGILNQGRRVDYVLQEAPFEFINEYIFALTSHVCYWESEDTMLLILKEIYNSMNISTDSKIPPPNMTIERPPSLTKSIRNNDPIASHFGMDPTLPMTTKTDIGPPPMAGFVRKS